MTHLIKCLIKNGESIKRSIKSGGQVITFLNERWERWPRKFWRETCEFALRNFCAHAKSVIMLCDVMQSVIILNVVAPIELPYLI
jgi:hypothetical protein